MAASKDAPSGEQTIEQLQKRFEALNTKRIQADRDLENAKKQLSTLQQEAREKYGTDEVAKLRQMLDEMKADNETKRRNYQSDLDRIESELKKVEQSFAQAGSNGDASQ